MAPKSLDQNIEDWVWKCLCVASSLLFSSWHHVPLIYAEEERRSEAVISVVVSIEDLWVSWDIKEDIQEMQSKKETKEGHKLTPPTAAANLQLNMEQFLQLHKSLELVKLLHQIGQTRRQVGKQGSRWQPK